MIAQGVEAPGRAKRPARGVVECTGDLMIRAGETPRMTCNSIHRPGVLTGAKFAKKAPPEMFVLRTNGITSEIRVD